MMLSIDPSQIRQAIFFGSPREKHVDDLDIRFRCWVLVMFVFWEQDMIASLRKIFNLFLWCEIFACLQMFLLANSMFLHMYSHIKMYAKPCELTGLLANLVLSVPNYLPGYWAIQLVWSRKEKKIAQEVTRLACELWALLSIYFTYILFVVKQR